MSENKKTFVTLGDKAEIFHDVYAGLTLRKGQVAGLTLAQRNKRKISNGINGGHLKVITAYEAEELVGAESFRKMNNQPETAKPKTVDGLENKEGATSGKALLESFKEKYDVESNSDEDVMKAFTKEQLEIIAKELGIEDMPKTKPLIYEAIVDEISEEE